VAGYGSGPKRGGSVKDPVVLLNPGGDRSYSNENILFGRPTMLAEIFFLRLEAAARTSELAVRKDPRFVPLPRDAFNTIKDRQPRESGKNV
jgi:hypothetical protein